MMKKSATIFQAFEEVCKDNAEKTAIYFPENGRYSQITYQDLYVKSTQLAGFLQESKIKLNDAVGIISENNIYWPAAFLGIVRLGAVAVPVNPELELPELSRLIQHSESKLILSSARYKEKIKEAAFELPVPVIALDEVCENFPLPGAVGDRPAAEYFSSEQTASLMYTSGTTGVPKAVILSHRNFLSNLYALKNTGLLTPKDCLICILPFYHSYPLMINLLLPLLSGAKISFPENLGFEAILCCIKKTKVTALIAVPRIFTLIYENIQENLKSLPFFKKIFLGVFLNFSCVLRNKFRINLSRLLLKSLHKPFGEDLRFLISGGAKLALDIANSFYMWGFTVLEGYGLTEASPVVSTNTPVHFRIGSAGKALTGIEIKINAPDSKGMGEVLIKGENITSGYYKDKKLTAETIRDGRLYSRDLGYIDKDGFLFIYGRTDELIILDSGEKINPEELEAYYSKSPFIKEMCIFLPATFLDKGLLTALVLPDLEHFQKRAILQIKDRIRLEIENLSMSLPAYKRIRKYTIINEPLPRTILGKIKRFEIESRFFEYSRLVEVKEKKQTLGEEDKLLLSSALSQRIVAYLSDKLKKPVDLDDHLELDLGLDSLERIGLFFEFQRLSGIKIDEKTFFNVATVRDILERLKTVPEAGLQKEETLTWKKILSAPLKTEIKEAITDKQGFLPKTANLFFLAVLFFISRAGFFLKVKDKKNIPKSGPFIFCANHASFLDGPLFMSALDTRIILNTYFLGYSAYINTPLLKWAKKLFRLIPIDPAFKLADTLAICSFTLNNSKILCMFPEGGRSVDGKVKEFKRGIGILIKELGVPVIPVYIRGTHNAWPVKKRFPKPAKVEIIFGEKLSPQELSQTQTKDIDIYQNIADNLRKRLLELETQK